MGARIIALHGDPKAPHQLRLAAALLARGLTPVLVDAPELAARATAELGVEVLHLELPKRWPPLLRTLVTRQRVRELGIQVAHLNYLHLGQRIWQDLGIPYVATAWGSDLNAGDFPRPPQHWLQMAALLRGAHAVTSDSEPLLERARALAAPSPLDCHHVLWGVESARFDPARLAPEVQTWRVRLGIAMDAFVVLSPRQTLGHYHPERTLEGFARMPPRATDVLVFKLHGRDAEPAMQAELEARAAALGLADRLRFAPPCAYAELPGLYASADVAVSALEVDGVPSTFVELMALRVPLLASDLPAYRGLLDDGRALRFAPTDVAALADGLRHLRDRPDLRASMAFAARQWALHHADWQASVDAWQQLYDAALRASGRAAAR